MKPSSLVAVDPGLNSMGYAMWSLRQPPLASSVPPPHTVGLLKAPRRLELAERARWLAHQLDETLDLNGGRGGVAFVSEYPAYHGSIRGWATGDLQKLTFLVGVLAGYFERAVFDIVTPGGWKGQMSKDVVIRRLQKRFGPGATREWERDMWDAVGIGLWKLGQF